jgi:hypothetical protein
VVGSISPERLDAALRDVNDALVRTAPSSVLPEDEQDTLLAQACAEACDVLGDWLTSPSWQQLSPSGESGSRPVADSVADFERLRPYLTPVTEAVTRVARRPPCARGAPGIEDPAAYVDNLISGARLTGRRQRKLDLRQLYASADSRLQALRAQACAIASGFRAGTEKQATDAERTARRRHVRAVLLKVAGVLFTVSVALASVSPGAAAQNIPQWGHDAIAVLFVHQVAHTAAPTVSIAPPRLGPRPG